MCRPGKKQRALRRELNLELDHKQREKRKGVTVAAVHPSVNQLPSSVRGLEGVTG